MKDIKIIKELEKLLIVGKIQFKLYDGELLTEDELKILASAPDDEILLGLQLVASDRLQLEKETKLNNLKCNVVRLNLLRNPKHKKSR
ncbi:MAG: hypothetical protein IJY25_02890 [Bacilli bacterium]|nr:hypothetical protein [Bacilli bacterium]